MKDKKKMLLVIVSILSVIVITVGVSFALFNYVKLGSTENSVTTGTITFLYTEVDKVGAGIKIENTTPITDTAGKMLTGSGNVFNFKITSTNKMNAAIPYEITARMKEDSTLDKDVVKVYLTKGETEEEVLLEKYGNLTQTERVLESVAIEKTIYNGRIPSNTSNYEETFKLRMWVDEETDYSPVEDEEENIVYPYNNKTFTLTVNVYADATVISQEEVDMDNSTKIETVTAGNTALTEVTGKNYDYEITLPEGTTSTILNVETENPNSTVKIEKIDSLALDTEATSNIVRLSTAKTVALVNGENYFKVTVTSPNKIIEKEYKVKVMVMTLLSKKILDNNKIITATPTLTSTSSIAGDKSGLYKSTATNSGDPTYYFRGNVTNNYVSFGGFTWRIIRINEDGTIRLILNNPITDSDGVTKLLYFRSSSGYYTDSEIKTELENWYSSNLKTVTSKIATGNYFCEQYKISWGGFNTNYTPTFKCNTDTNQKGYVNTNIGFINYDEAVFAGGYYDKRSTFYLQEGGKSWTMSPAGKTDGAPHEWVIVESSTESIDSNRTLTYNDGNYLRPVINLKADVEWASGTGTSSSPYKIK